MDALGMDIVIIETVGVGQDEVDIVKAAHTTCVVMVPGLGDDIQAIKAGILEIGDVFVVNKADREGADRTARELSNMLDMRPLPEGGWKPQVLKTEAQRNVGISELVGEMLAHRDFLFTSGTIANFLRERNKRHFIDILRDSLYKNALEYIERNGTLDKVLDDIDDASVDPYSAAEQVMNGMLKKRALW
jgi:LAO/AO transport system kinase